ncbi:hypothetical protein BOO92_03130 [Vibrio navarrensis]|uniref:hypothetical protein n=1 Tax=Vibrio navarrensis TaxID=29495 RepID=UPI00186899C7|nr:hypothetical protein [Vibrio navarrensis]MBE3655697.1 hypothetical protein [Vibrio navarrensis]
MINNIYGGLLSILWRTAQIVFFGGEERKRWFWVLGPWSWEKRKSKGGREGPGFWALGPGKSERARAEEREKKVLGSGPWVLGRAKAGKAGNEFSRS